MQEEAFDLCKHDVLHMLLISGVLPMSVFYQSVKLNRPLRTLKINLK